MSARSFPFLNPAKVGDCIDKPSFSNLKTLEDKTKKKFNSMGRIMMSFIGHPLAVSGMFDEVQMVFYPFNQHAGGARVHTTASLPIEHDLFKAKLVRKMIKSSNITVTNFFSFFEKSTPVSGSNCIPTGVIFLGNGVKVLSFSGSSSIDLLVIL